MATKKKVTAKKTAAKRKSAPKTTKSVVKAKKVTTKKVAEEKVGKKPVQLVIRKQTMIKFAIGFVIALLLIPVLDFVVQASITSKYAAFYGANDVSRKEYLVQLEAQYGEEVLSSLVAKAAVLEEAEAQEIEVTEEEIDASIAGVRVQFGIEDDEAFALALEQAGITEESFRDETTVVLYLNKIVEGDVVAPTEAEVEAFFAENKDTLYVGQTYEEVKGKIADDILNGALNTKGQEWLAAKMEKYDQANFLVSEESKSYSFLKSLDLLEMLFADDSSVKEVAEEAQVTL